MYHSTCLYEVQGIKARILCTQTSLTEPLRLRYVERDTWNLVFGPKKLCLKEGPSRAPSLTPQAGRESEPEKGSYFDLTDHTGPAQLCPPAPTVTLTLPTATHMPPLSPCYKQLVPMVNCQLGMRRPFFHKADILSASLLVGRCVSCNGSGWMRQCSPVCLRFTAPAIQKKVRGRAWTISLQRRGLTEAGAKRT